MLVSSISKVIYARLAEVQAASSAQPTLFCSARAISNGLPANQLPFLAADKGQHFPRAGKLFLIRADDPQIGRSEEHTSELQSLMRISYAVFCLKKKKKYTKIDNHQE